MKSLVRKFMRRIKQFVLLWILVTAGFALNDLLRARGDVEVARARITAVVDHCALQTQGGGDHHPYCSVTGMGWFPGRYTITAVHADRQGRAMDFTMAGPEDLGMPTVGQTFELRRKASDPRVRLGDVSQEAGFFSHFFGNLFPMGILVLLLFRLAAPALDVLEAWVWPVRARARAEVEEAEIAAAEGNGADGPFSKSLSRWLLVTVIGMALMDRLGFIRSSVFEIIFASGVIAVVAALVSRPASGPRGAGEALGPTEDFPVPSALVPAVTMRVSKTVPVQETGCVVRRASSGEAISFGRRRV